MTALLLNQAHRGAGFLEAENCVEAVELGWSLGLVPEIDVSTTRDGMIVGFHDRDLQRLVRGMPESLRGRSLDQADWAELRSLDVGEAGRPRRIPTVAEVLARLRGDPRRRLYLDIKRVAFPALAALVHDASVAEQVIFSTDRDAWITEWRRLMPQGETLRWVWMEPEADGWARASAAIADLRRGGYAGVTQLQLHILVGEPSAEFPLHPGGTEIAALASELAGRGILFQAFPHSGNPEVYARLLALGVRSFATDHPHQLRAALAAWTPA